MTARYISRSRFFDGAQIELELLPLEAPVAVIAIAPSFQAPPGGFIAFYDGTTDPTLHKIEYGISA